MRKALVILFLLCAQQAHAARIMVHWSYASDHSNRECGFRIWRQTPDGYVQVGMASPGQPLFVDSGLTNGVRYCYKVSAFNASGEAFSAEQCGVPTLLYDEPAWPQNVPPDPPIAICFSHTLNP